VPDEAGMPPAPAGFCAGVPALELPAALGLVPGSGAQPHQKVAKLPSKHAETSLMILLGVQRPQDPRVGRQ
jgi:hypothetical protein